MKIKQFYLLIIISSFFIIFDNCSKDAINKSDKVNSSDKYLLYSDYISSSDGYQKSGYVPLTNFSTGAIEIKEIKADDSNLTYKKITSKFSIKDNSSSSADLSDFLPPVGNQGKQNSCVGWAWGYYYKTYQENKENNRSSYQERSNALNICSPSFIYNMIHIKDDNGSMPDDAFRVLNDFGCAKLSLMPYDEDKYTKWPSEKAYSSSADWRTSVSGNGEYYSLTLDSENAQDQLKQLLLNGKPALFGVAIYQNLLDIKNYNNILTLADKSGENKGGHAQMIVGFDDNITTADGKGAFRVVNSWGKSWGDNGFYWITYQALRKGSAYLLEDKVMWVDDKNNYKSKHKAVLNLSSSNARTTTTNLSLGNASFTFFDFTFGGSNQISAIAFPDTNIVIDVENWASSLTEGAELKLYFKASSWNSNSEDSINSFSYINTETESKDDAPNLPATSGSNGVVVKATVGSGSADNSNTDDNLDTNFSDDSMIVPCEACCSSGISNMASNMGVNMYKMFSWIPFFGNMMNQMAGKFFAMILRSPQMTLDMIICAKVNSGMADMMIEVVEGNPELLVVMQNIMMDHSVFTYHFTDLAIRNHDIGVFFFRVLTDGLLEGLTFSMLDSNEVIENVGALMKEHATGAMQPGTTFSRIFFNIGTSGNTCDGNEQSNERFFYTMFGNISAANDFLDSLESLDANMQQALLDFVFLGKQQDNSGNITIHAKQKYHFNYAIIKALAEKIAPQYDVNEMPNPESENPANALFGRFMPTLMNSDAQGNMTPTPYGLAFFQTLMAGVQSADPYAQGMMNFFGGMFPPELFAMLPAPDENAVVPRDFTSKTNACLEAESIPDPVCSPMRMDLCSDDTSCQEIGGYWYDAACNAEPGCEAAHIDKCTNEGDCLAIAGTYWWPNNSCNDEAAPACGSANLDLCLDNSSCSNAGGNWWTNSSCQAETEPVCDSEHLNLCENSSTCNTAGAYWYNDICNAQTEPVCDANNINLCTSQTICENATLNWCSDVCRSDSCPVNIAASAYATASIQNWPDFSIEYINDENTQTAWASWQLPHYDWEEWIQLDFGSTKSFHKVIIDWNGSDYARRFSLWYWGYQGWMMLTDNSKNTEGTSIDYFNTVQARYFKIRMINGINYFNIKEIRVE